MATTRFSLIQWDDDTAAVDRTQFNDAFASIDNLGAGYTQTTGAPGAASAAKVGFIHFNTTDDTLFYCDGSTWQQINLFANTTDSTISAITPGDSKSAGSSTDIAKADHVHEMPAFGSISNLASSATASNGSATTFSRSDHVHGIPNGTITNAMLAGSIDGSKLAAGTITDTQMGANSVGNSQIKGDAVTLGTQTTGDYVATVASGTNIVVSGSGGETAAVTVNHATMATPSPSSNANGGVAITTVTLTNGHVTDYTTYDFDSRFLGISATAADSDELGGVAAANYLRSDTTDTTTGRLTIDTSNVGAAGNQSLNILDTSSQGLAGISFRYPNNSSTVQHGVFRMSNNNLHRYVFLQENNSSLADAQLQNLYYSGSLTSTSDETLKNNEGPALGLSFVNRLSPFTGTWIDGDGDKHQFLGAQSVEAALTAEGVNASDYGMIGNDSEIGPRTMSYMELVPVLVKAVQELTDRLEVVEAGS